MTNEEIIEVGAFNNGCDLTLSNIENYIVELEQAGEPVEVKYARVLRMIVGMRAVIETRIAPKEEPPAVIVPDSQIIIAS